MIRGRPDAWKYAGGNNTWSEFAIDAKRGIAYFPLGSPTLRFVWRRPDRRGLVRQLSTCARCANRQTDLALPDRSSRSLGLRTCFSGLRHDVNHLSIVANVSSSGRQPGRNPKDRDDGLVVPNPFAGSRIERK